VPERGAVDQRHAEDLDDHFQREPIRERLDDVDFFTLAKPIEQIVRDRLDPWLELRDRTGLEGAGDQLPQLSVPRLVAREHPQRRIAAARVLVRDTEKPRTGRQRRLGQQFTNRLGLDDQPSGEIERQPHPVHRAGLPQGFHDGLRITIKLIPGS
jgi:hypothetical protein